MFKKGMSGGEMPLLAGTPHPGNARAITDVTLYRISEQNFWQLLADCEAVRRKILKDMAERLQEINQLSYQREKLISLGTMAAGLAHELNNPASAARRASQRLRETLDAFDQHSSSMLKACIFKPEVDISGYPFQPILDRRQLDGVSTDALSRADQEDELADWLEERGFDDPYEMASTFVEVGYDQPLLAGFSEKLLPEQVNNFLQWVHKEMEMLRLANDLQESTSRLQTLVTAVKEYSYMDQGSHVQQVDLHKSLDNTLLVLNHKSKHKGIRFVKEYGQDVPSIEAYGGELNQVWTNLLDNAIDAVPEQGGQDHHPHVRGRLWQSHPTDVRGKSANNGSGIPKESRRFSNRFSPRTRQGTGIGLEISTASWWASTRPIEVEVRPGDTKITVYLPITCLG
jgi:signal transduction histidine kinase